MSDSKPSLLCIDHATLVKESVPILRELNLEIPEGRHTAILGPNGSGKSSLIKLITSHHYALAHADQRPTVTLFGEDRWNVFDLRAMLGIVSSEMHQSFVEGRIHGLEAVVSGYFASHGLARHHKVTSEMRENASSVPALVEADHLAKKPMDEMSTGEARRILIARALVRDPRALLLDEPTAGLDIVARRRFLETLRRIAQQGKTVILVTHHIEEIIPEIEHVVLLKEGRVFQEGSKPRLLSNSILSAVFEAPIMVSERSGWYSAEMQTP